MTGSIMHLIGQERNDSQIDNLNVINITLRRSYIKYRDCEKNMLETMFFRTIKKYTQKITNKEKRKYRII